MANNYPDVVTGLFGPSFGLGVGAGAGAGYRYRPIRSLVAIAVTYIADTAVKNDGALLVDATAAAFTVNLPPAPQCKGMEVVVKKIDASTNAVTVQDANGALIEGAATAPLATQYTTIHVMSDGVGWWKV